MHKWTHSVPLSCLPVQSMSHALKVGFQSFFNRRSFAEIPRVLKVGKLVLLSPRAMGPRRLRSMSSLAATRSKLTEPMSVESPQAEKGSIKENVVKGTSKILENEIIEDDPDALEGMTVQQLRVKLRSVGLPAEGSKHDLVSALKSVLESKVDEEGSLVLDDGMPSKIEQDCSKSNSKRKAKSSSGTEHIESINAVSEDQRLKRSKRTVKKASVGDSIIEVKSTVYKSKKKLLIETDEISGSVSAKKYSRAKRKVGSETACGDLLAPNTVDLSTNQSEPWIILAHKKPQKGWIPYNPRTMRPPPPQSNMKYVKLMSWNVNGLRALLKLEGFSALELAQRENFDVLCLQETKLQEKDVEVIKKTLLDGYENSFWTCSVSKLGYSGTAIISRIKPLSVRYGLGISDHDSEGRLVTAEFDSFYLLSAYVPNSGDGLKRLSYRVAQWDPSLGSYMKELEKSKPVILTGDLNCAHEEIDIFNPAGNRRSAGFTDEERQSFETNFLRRGFVDTFRKQHPGTVAYTYWGYRHDARRANKGWRLDYFLVSESISDNVYDSYILPDVTGSDHSPVGLILKL